MAKQATTESDLDFPDIYDQPAATQVADLLIQDVFSELRKATTDQRAAVHLNGETQQSIGAANGVGAYLSAGSFSETLGGQAVSGRPNSADLVPRRGVIEADGTIKPCNHEPILLASTTLWRDLKKNDLAQGLANGIPGDTESKEKLIRNLKDQLADGEKPEEMISDINKELARTGSPFRLVLGKPNRSGELAFEVLDQRSGDCAKLAKIESNDKQRQAQKIAEALRDGKITDSERIEIENAYKDAFQKDGQDSAREMTKAVNEQLEKCGSEFRLAKGESTSKGLFPQCFDLVSVKGAPRQNRVLDFDLDMPKETLDTRPKDIAELSKKFGSQLNPEEKQQLEQLLTDLFDGHAEGLRKLMPYSNGGPSEAAAKAFKEAAKHLGYTVETGNWNQRDAEGRPVGQVLIIPPDSRQGVMLTSTLLDNGKFDQDIHAVTAKTDANGQIMKDKNQLVDETNNITTPIESITREWAKVAPLLRQLEKAGQNIHNSMHAKDAVAS